MLVVQLLCVRAAKAMLQPGCEQCEPSWAIPTGAAVLRSCILVLFYFMYLFIYFPVAT